MVYGNNPRFGWEPSTTMGANRLDSTTEASVSYRDGPDKSQISLSSGTAAL